MINSHLFKVLLGFCGMILIGLISLVVIDSMKNKSSLPSAKANNTVTTLPPIKK